MYDNESGLYYDDVEDIWYDIDGVEDTDIWEEEEEWDPYYGDQYL